MSWFAVLKMYGDEEDYLSREMISLLEDNESIQYKYTSLMEEIDSERYNLGKEILELAKKDNLDDYVMRAIKSYMENDITSERHFDDLWQAISDTYIERKRNGEEEEEDPVPQLKYGNKNQETLQTLEDFQGQYYENEFTDYRTNREMSAFMAAVSRGDTDNLERDYPEAYLIFNEAGLLNDLE